MVLDVVSCCDGRPDGLGLPGTNNLNLCKKFLLFGLQHASVELAIPEDRLLAAHYEVLARDRKTMTEAELKIPGSAQMRMEEEYCDY